MSFHFSPHRASFFDLALADAMAASDKPVRAFSPSEILCGTSCLFLREETDALDGAQDLLSLLANCGGVLLSQPGSPP